MRSSSSSLVAGGGISVTTSPSGRSSTPLLAGSPADALAHPLGAAEGLLVARSSDQLDARHQAALAHVADVRAAVRSAPGADRSARPSRGSPLEHVGRARTGRGWPAPRRSRAGCRCRCGRGRTCGPRPGRRGRRRTPPRWSASPPAAGSRRSGPWPGTASRARTPSCSQANIVPGAAEAGGDLVGDQQHAVLAGTVARPGAGSPAGAVIMPAAPCTSGSITTAASLGAVALETIVAARQAVAGAVGRRARRAAVAVRGTGRSQREQQRPEHRRGRRSMPPTLTSPSVSPW